MQFGEKTNGQTFRKTDKSSFRKTHCTNGQTFQKKKNAVLINRASYIKTNGQTLKKRKADAVW